MVRSVSVISVCRYGGRCLVGGLSDRVQQPCTVQSGEGETGNDAACCWKRTEENTQSLATAAHRFVCDVDGVLFDQL